MTIKDKNKALGQILQHYGSAHQVDKAIEEMAELTKALLKFREDSIDENLDNIIEELGDVLVMCCQLGIIYDCGDDVERIIDTKIKRQLERIKFDNEENPKKLCLHHCSERCEYMGIDNLTPMCGDCIFYKYHHAGAYNRFVYK